MNSIAIIGAGIGGCTTYLFLKKYLSPEVSIRIYESYPQPPYLSNIRKKSNTSTANAAQVEENSDVRDDSVPNVTSANAFLFLCLSPNGVRVIKALNDNIYERIKAVGVEVEGFGAQLSSGTLLGELKAGGKRHGHGTILVSRVAMHNALLEQIDAGDMSFNMKVTRVSDGEKAAKIEFANGDYIASDIVIGADGVWSKTREAIPEAAQYKPQYDGLVSIGAFMDKDMTCDLLASIESKKGIVIPKSPMTLTFGSGGFFGTLLNQERLNRPSPNEKFNTGQDFDFELPFSGWWSILPMDPAPEPRTSFAAVKDTVMAKHKEWTPLIPTMIEKSSLTENGQGTFVLPRYITPSLPKWTSNSGRIILMGDAAHCMSADSAQGVSCAVEDAMTLSLLFKALLSSSFASAGTSEGNDTSYEHKLKNLCDLYVKIRKPRCDYIVEQAKRRGNMKRELSWWEETIRNSVLYITCKILPHSAYDGLFSWDVETEVEKALKGQIPAAKGEGPVHV